MAIIYSYPQVKPKTTDLLVGTVVYQSDEANPVDGNPTRTFSLRDVGELLSSYKLSSKALGPNATIILSDDFDHISAVNLIRGSGISISDNGSNNITLSNTGVLSVAGANTTFINSTPVLTSTGAVTVSSSLSASGGAGNRTYLRGDNTWSTPVLTVNTFNTSFIDLSPTSSTNGDVIVSASLSAAGTPSASRYLRGDNTWSTPLNSIEASNTTYIATTLSTSETGNVSFSSALSATGTPSSLNFLRGDNVWAVPAGGGTLTSIVAGNGISVDDTDPANPVVSNTGVLSVNTKTGDAVLNTDDINEGTTNLYDKVVTIEGDGATTVTSNYPSFTISSTDTIGLESVVAGDDITVDSTDPLNPIINNSAPDRTVVLEEGPNITISGIYPSFTISAADAPESAVTSVNTQTGAVVLDTDDIAEGLTNLYDKTVSITGSGAAVVTGDYPSFNVSVTPGEAGAIAKNNFISNGVQTDYQLSVTPTSATYTEVFISGVYQEASTYTLSSDTITLSTPADNGDTIEVVIFDLGTAGSGGGSGAVDSVNGETGVVVLDSDDISDIGKTNQWDKTVVLTGGGATTVTGDYPSFTVSTPIVDTSSFVSNEDDTYATTPKVTNIVTLTQAEYDLLSPANVNTMYLIIG